MSNLIRLIERELNEWDLSCCEDSILKSEIAKAIAVKVLNSKIPTPERKALLKRSEKIELLGHYSVWLEEHGYTDIDWRVEPPYAIDEFMKLEK